MYRRIMVPVDLAHIAGLDKALKTAAGLSKQYAVPVSYVGVAAAAPGAVAHNPAEFAAKLDAFAKDQAAAHGLSDASAAPYTSHDPSVDLDQTLLKAAEDTDADLIVMGSHIPGFPEHIFTSNAGYVASHAKVSVFVVR